MSHRILVVDDEAPIRENLYTFYAWRGMRWTRLPTACRPWTYCASAPRPGAVRRDDAALQRLRLMAAMQADAL